MGHFWWSWAEYSPREDWLNEGLAEYAAARFVRETCGDKAYAALLAQYRRAATKAGTEATAIVETPSDSAWTYANRYAKPALLLDALERSLGSDRIGRFLKAMHDSALARNALTTDTAQTIARDTLGDEPARLFARCLAVRGWPTECGG
jgi:aminopeptidase N